MSVTDEEGSSDGRMRLTVDSKPGENVERYGIVILLILK
jgi:hypothetical protein